MRRRASIIVLEERLPRGYIGPCEERDCAKPADCTLILSLDGVRVHTWTCHEHRDTLIGEPVPA